jgi:hygromycin-B 4-O-kinase
MTTPYRPPVVSEASARELLAEHFSEPIDALEPLAGGEISRAFSFEAAGRGHILKFNADVLDANFEKDVFVAREFSSDAVPIPAIVAQGRTGDLHFVVMERAVGTAMDRLTADQVAEALPAVLSTLSAIHSVGVDRFDGHGLFDGEGRGFFPSWRANLESVGEEEREDGFYGKWHSLFDETFLERDVFDSVFDRMIQLADDCPEDRRLVHGDFGFGNLLLKDGRVTAVIDWTEAKWGDFVYDVAWLDFWAPDGGLAALIARDYEIRGISVPAFAERLLCYQCYVGLDAMRFFARSDQEQSYGFARGRVLYLLGVE